MATKGLILLGVGFLTYLGLIQSPRALEMGLRHYLQQTFPGAKVKVRIAAPLFWFFSGNLRRITVEMSQFDASRFPFPIGAGVTPAPPAPEVHVRSQDNNGASDSPDPVGDAIRAAAEAASGNGRSSTIPEAAPAPPPGRPAPESAPMPGTAPTPGSAPTPEMAPSQGQPAPGMAQTLPGTGTATPRPAPPIRWAHVAHVEIHLTDFQYFGQHIHDFRASLPSVRYDYNLARKQRLVRLGGSSPGVLHLLLSGADLSQATTLDRTDIRSLFIHTEAGHLRVTLDYHTVLGWVPVSVTGQLSIVQGHAIDFVNPAISAVNVPFPQPVTDFILKRVQNLNPVFDLDRLSLPLDVNLTSAQSTDQGLVVQATIQVPGGP